MFQLWIKSGSDTTITFETGVTVHVMTGWILPNTANCITVQSGRLLYTDGAIDLWKEWYGYHEVTAAGIQDRNVLFLNFGPDGRVDGYGISTPGRILEEIAAHRAGEAVAEQARSPVTSGLLTTLICESAHESLARGGETAEGVISGEVIATRKLLEQRIGMEEAAAYYRRT